MCTYLLAAELGTSNFSFFPESFSITSPLRSPSTVPPYPSILLVREERGEGRGERGEGRRPRGRQATTYLPTGTLEHWNTGTLEHWNTGTGFCPERVLTFGQSGGWGGEGEGTGGGLRRILRIIFNAQQGGRGARGSVQIEQFSELS